MGAKIFQHSVRNKIIVFHAAAYAQPRLLPKFYHRELQKENVTTAALLYSYYIVKNYLKDNLTGTTWLISYASLNSVIPWGRESEIFNKGYSGTFFYFQAFRQISNEPSVIIVKFSVMKPLLELLK